MLKFRQHFCSHEFSHKAYHPRTNQQLMQCDKCNVYCIVHVGTGLFYLDKTTSIEGWIYS